MAEQHAQQIGNMDDVDRGWAFVVLFAAFSNQVIVALLTYGTGIIHIALLDKYNKSEAMTSFVGSLYISLLSIMGPFVSYIANRWSCRAATIFGGVLLLVGFTCSFLAQSLEVLLITYGGISGIGLSLICGTGPMVIGYGFEKYFSIACGILASGVGFGSMIAGPVLEHILENYGFHGMFLLLGAVGFQSVMFGMLMRPSQKESNKHKKDCNEQRFHQIHEYVRVLKNKSYISVLSGSMLFNMSFCIVMIFLPSYAVNIGAQPNEAALLLTIMGIGGTVIKLLVGPVIAPDGLDPLVLNFGATAIVGILVCLLPVSPVALESQIIFSFLFGIYCGGHNTFIMNLTVKMVGENEISTAFGIWYLFVGVGVITGPPLSGFILDYTRSYVISFMITGSIFLLSSVISLTASFSLTKTEDVRTVCGKALLSNITEYSVTLSQEDNSIPDSHKVIDNPPADGEICDESKKSFL